ncbi:MAG: tRNA pseudouridine(55) synthase TruB [Opitutales bacterium]
MSASAPSTLEGILLVDKPTGMTSHDVVDRLRRKLQMKKIGHAGTLDPNATGLLIMLIGKATKVSQYLMSLDKEYSGEIKLGEETTTYDSEGEVTLNAEVSAELTAEKLQAAMDEFRGDQYQLPPMFSAKKVDGVPLYKMARKGQEIEREPRFIRVERFSLEHFEPPHLRFNVACSKGTYVRTLAHDLGQKLGCGAHLSALSRTATDQFRLDDAASLESIEEMTLAEIRRRLIPVYQAVPSHVLS